MHLVEIYYTLTQIDSKSALEKSQVCIAIAGLYINLTKPLWIKMLVEQNLSNDNILKITILPILPQDDCTTFLPK